MNLIPRNDFFDDAFDILDSSFLKNNNIMKSDIYEQNNNYVIEIDLPGFDKNDVNIDYYNEYLTIKASKKEENEEKGKYIRKERYYGEYKRSFYIGEIDENNIKANFNNGVLKIVFPKEQIKKESKRQISID